MDRFDEIDKKRPPTNVSSSSVTFDASAGVTPDVKPSATAFKIPPIGIGFANLDELKSDIKSLEKVIGEIRDQCIEDLKMFALIIPPAKEASSQVDNLGSPDDEMTLREAYINVCKQLKLKDRSNTVSFPFYVYLMKNSSTSSALYLRSAYEMALRNEGGSNLLDVMLLLLIIQSETERIKKFINDYIKEFNDTSEYRTVENFQTWTENARIFVNRLRKTANKGYTASLPNSDLDVVKKKEASEFQAIFKIKLNVLNKKLINDISIIMKEFVDNSDYFYKKVLGPSLKFRLKIGTSIIDAAKTQVLAKEGEQGITKMNIEMSMALADQLKRNKIFRFRYNEIIDDLLVRDTYANYIMQLSSKGIRIKSKFRKQKLTDEEEKLFKLSLTDYNLIKSILKEKSFSKSHSILDDLDDDNAHPQYLLRGGGTLTGSVLFANATPNITIDGIVPSKHKHDGLDGSVKISGADLKLNSITDKNVNTTKSTTPVPTGLKVVNQVAAFNTVGQSKVTVEVEFDIDNINYNVADYDFEIVKL